MTDFEDGLWSELVSGHATELLQMGPRPRGRRRRSWRAPLAVGGTALTGAIVAAALTLTASTSPPAYALVVSPNGSVTLTLRELIGIKGANTQLAKLGVRARVVKISPRCNARGDSVPFPRPRSGASDKTGAIGGIVESKLLRSGRGAFGRIRMVIYPRAIPRADTLILTARLIDSVHDGTRSHALAMSFSLHRGAGPNCGGRGRQFVERTQ